MILRSSNTFTLAQTMTDQILLIVNGTVSQPVIRVWHVSKKQEALNEWERYHDF